MKYEITTNTKKLHNVTLYQIRAVKDFGNVKKGDLGGYIESEKNLSQEGNAWVYGNARVFDKAWVYGNASVYGYARVTGNARVFEDVEVKITETVPDFLENLPSNVEEITVDGIKYKKKTIWEIVK